MWVEIQYTVTCLNCGHEYKNTHRVDNTNVRYAPIIPTKCDRCKYDMYSYGPNYNITVEVTRFVESP